MNRTVDSALAHGMVLTITCLQDQRDALQRDLDVTTSELVSALTETYLLRDAIERAVKFGLHPTVDRILREALLPVPAQREGS